MNQPLYITAASKTNGAPRFIDSLRRIKDEVEFLFIEFLPHYPDQIDKRTWMMDFENARRIKFVNINYPGNIQRWKYIYSVIKTLKLDEDPGRWVIFSDTDDVMLQRSLPVLDQGRHIYLSSEGITHKEAEYWVPIIKKYPSFRPLLEEPIYNAGVWMMRMRYVVDWLEFVLERAEKHVVKRTLSHDQLFFNLWLTKQNKRYFGHSPNLMVSLYNNKKLGTVKKEKGFFINPNGEPYTFVHANGSTKKDL
jgi:hypothetical protein